MEVDSGFVRSGQDREGNDARFRPGRRDAHATFFLLGENHVLKYPGVVRQIADAGDEIGNHTWTHQILTEIEPAKAREELALTQDAIERIHLVARHLCGNSPPAVPGILAELDRRGYTVVTVSQLLAPATPKPGMVCRP
ncbi:polysaccharide deacetylase family protein [Actinopolymorpha pittospori]